MTSPGYDLGPARAPDWLLAASPTPPPAAPGRQRGRSFLEKTLRGGSDLLRRTMFSEDLAHGPGLLQRLDPRAKVVGMAALLVAAGLAHHIAVLLAVYGGTLLLAAASRVPIDFFLKRVWLFVPVFTLVVVLPATLSVVTPGPVVVELWSWHGHPQGLTATGLASAALVVTRVAVSISLVLLVTVTTPWTRLLTALRSLGMPRIFVMVVGMAYRYVFLLLESVREMYESRRARTIGAAGHDRSARAFVGASAGALLGKANQLSEEVHQAMVARGYRGEPRVLDALRLRRVDLLVAGAALLTAVTVVWVDRMVGR